MSIDHFYSPRNVGDASEPSFTGRAASTSCGASLRVSIQVDESQRIAQARFKAAGCSVLVATLSLLTEAVTGKTTAEAATCAKSPGKLTGAMEGLDSTRSDCVSLAVDALLNAIREFSNAAREDWLGSDSLICTCFCVSEQTINQEIIEKGITSVVEVTRVCGAGGGCGSCHSLIQDLIDLSLEDY